MNATWLVKAIATAGLLLVTSQPVNAAEVSVSIQGQLLPGIYTQVQVVDPAPRYVSYPQYVVEQPVTYIVVPHHHRKNWRKHCRAYHACGQRVYFVDAPRKEYRKHHGSSEHRRYRADEHRYYRD